MAQSINQVIIVGNVGADPEMNQTRSGDPVARVRVACTESWVTNGQKQEQTNWITVIAFRQAADYLARFVKKGMKLGVVGKIVVRQFEHQGQNREAVEVHAREFLPFGDGQGGQQGRGGYEGGYEGGGRGGYEGGGRGGYEGGGRGGYQQRDQGRQAPPGRDDRRGYDTPPQGDRGYQGGGGAAPQGGFNDLDDEIPF